jgi:4-hydroxy-tetrahydrodipicolinate synthase
MNPSAEKAISGVFPVLPTPFDANLQPDREALKALVRYLLRSGVDGMTYPGVASEFAQLTQDERLELTQLVLTEVAGRVPVVVGVSSDDMAITLALAKSAAAAGAAALMVAAPSRFKTAAEQVVYFAQLAAAAQGVAIMLQNVPPPVGAGLDPEVVVQILQSVPAVRYVKEEALPSGQRLAVIRQLAPASLLGVFGGAGGRYITDELRRGACGTMPAIELAEVHVALFAAHRKGNAALVRNIFTRMLPILNIQAVFRWSLTKYVLQYRGLIAHAGQRIAGPRLDALDQQDVVAFLGDLDDLLLSGAEIDQCQANTRKGSHGAA